MQHPSSQVPANMQVGAAAAALQLRRVAQGGTHGGPAAPTPEASAAALPLSDVRLGAALRALDRCMQLLHRGGGHADAAALQALDGLVERAALAWPEEADAEVDIDTGAPADGWDGGTVDMVLPLEDARASGPQAMAEPARDAAASSAASSLAVYLHDIQGLTRLDAGQEQTLALRVRAGDAEAAAQMIVANLTLVVAVARPFRSSGMPLEDLIGDGNLGLIEAVARFDPQRGVRFATYARFWIKQSIRQGILDHSRTVRLPVHVIRDVTRVMRAQRQGAAPAGGHATELGRLAQATGKSIAEVGSLVTHAQLPLSLDLPVGGEDSSMLRDTLVDPQDRDPASRLVSDQVLDTLLACVQALSRTERVVILRRYGFETGEPDTLENVGSLLGLTAERVRQIQKAALPKLKAELQARGLDAAALFGQ